MNISIERTPVFVATVIIIVVGLFVYAVRDKPGRLTLSTGDSEITMSFSGNALDLNELLDELLKHPRQWNETKAILRETYGLYEIDEPLVDHLRKESGHSSIASSLRGLLIDLKGPFQRDYHQFHDITKPDIVTAINTLGYEHEVAKEMRHLRDRATGIFDERGVEVEISLLDPGEIDEGQAVLCNGSQYQGLDLLLLNPTDYQKLVRVFARNTSPCIRAPSGDATEIERVRIRPVDGQKLYGDTAEFGAARAILYPVANGYTVKPYMGTSVAVAGVN